MVQKSLSQRWHDEYFLIERLHHGRGDIGNVSGEKRRHFRCGVAYGIVDISCHHSVMRQCRDERVSGILRSDALDTE